jgi:hypothetical protein
VAACTALGGDAAEIGKTVKKVQEIVGVNDISYAPLSYDIKYRLGAHYENFFCWL